MVNPDFVSEQKLFKIFGLPQRICLENLEVRALSTVYPFSILNLTPHPLHLHLSSEFAEIVKFQSYNANWEMLTPSEKSEYFNFREASLDFGHRASCLLSSDKFSCESSSLQDQPFEKSVKDYTFDKSNENINNVSDLNMYIICNIARKPQRRFMQMFNQDSFISNFSLKPHQQQTFFLILNTSTKTYSDSTLSNLSAKIFENVDIFNYLNPSSQHPDLVLVKKLEKLKPNKSKSPQSSPEREILPPYKNQRIKNFVVSTQLVFSAWIEPNSYQCSAAVLDSAHVNLLFQSGYRKISIKNEYQNLHFYDSTPNSVYYKDINIANDSTIPLEWSASLIIIKLISDLLEFQSDPKLSNSLASRKNSFLPQHQSIDSLDNENIVSNVLKIQDINGSPKTCGILKPYCSEVIRIVYNTCFNCNVQSLLVLEDIDYKKNKFDDHQICARFGIEGNITDLQFQSIADVGSHQNIADKNNISTNKQNPSNSYLTSESDLDSRNTSNVNLIELNNSLSSDNTSKALFSENYSNIKVYNSNSPAISVPPSVASMDFQPDLESRNSIDSTFQKKNYEITRFKSRNGKNAIINLDPYTPTSDSNSVAQLQSGQVTPSEHRNSTDQYFILKEPIDTHDKLEQGLRSSVVSRSSTIHKRLVNSSSQSVSENMNHNKGRKQRGRDKKHQHIVDELILKPGSTKGIYMLILHSPQNYNSHQDPGLLNNHNFTIESDYTNYINGLAQGQHYTLSIPCVMQSCSSIISAAPLTVDTGPISVGSVSKAYVKIENKSDIEAEFRCSVDSKIVNCNKLPMNIPPRESIQLSIDIYPRRINPRYRKQINIVNLKNKNQPDLIINIKSEHIDPGLMSYHNLFYKTCVDKNVQNFIDLGKIPINSPVLRVIKVENLCNEPIEIEILPEDPEIIKVLSLCGNSGLNLDIPFNNKPEEACAEIDKNHYLSLLALENLLSNTKADGNTSYHPSLGATEHALKLIDLLKEAVIHGNRETFKEFISEANSTLQYNELKLQNRNSINQPNKNIFNSEIFTDRSDTQSKRSPNPNDNSFIITQPNSTSKVQNSILPKKTFLNDFKSTLTRTATRSQSFSQGFNKLNNCFLKNDLIEKCDKDNFVLKNKLIDELASKESIASTNTATNQLAGIKSSNIIFQKNTHFDNNLNSALYNTKDQNVFFLDRKHACLIPSAFEYRKSLANYIRKGYSLAYSINLESDNRLVSTSFNTLLHTSAKNTSRYNNNSIDKLSSYLTNQVEPILEGSNDNNNNFTGEKNISQALSSKMDITLDLNKVSTVFPEFDVDSNNYRNLKNYSISDQKSEKIKYEHTDKKNDIPDHNKQESNMVPTHSLNSSNILESLNKYSSVNLKAYLVALQLLKTVIFGISKVIHSNFISGKEENDYARNQLDLRKYLDILQKSNFLTGVKKLTLPAKAQRPIFVLFSANREFMSENDKTFKQFDTSLYFRISKYPKQQVEARRLKAVLKETPIENFTELPLCRYFIQTELCSSRLEIQMKSINMGVVKKNETAKKYILIRNPNPIPLLYAIRKTGSIASGDIIFEDYRYGVVRGYDEKKLYFIFKPRLSGNYSEKIFVTNVVDLEQSQVVTLKAVVTKPSNFYVNNLTLDFGVAEIKQNSTASLKPRLLAIKNTSQITRIFIIKPKSNFVGNIDSAPEDTKAIVLESDFGRDQQFKHNNNGNITSQISKDSDIIAKPKIFDSANNIESSALLEKRFVNLAGNNLKSKISVEDLLDTNVANLEQDAVKDQKEPILLESDIFKKKEDKNSYILGVNFLPHEYLVNSTISHNSPNGSGHQYGKENSQRSIFEGSQLTQDVSLMHLSREDLEVIESLEQKIKIATRKNRPDKVEKYKKKINLLKFGSTPQSSTSQCFENSKEISEKTTSENIETTLPQTLTGTQATLENNVDNLEFFSSLDQDTANDVKKGNTSILPYAESGVCSIKEPIFTLTAAQSIENNSSSHKQPSNITSYKIQEDGSVIATILAGQLVTVPVSVKILAKTISIETEIVCLTSKDSKMKTNMFNPEPLEYDVKIANEEDIKPSNMNNQEIQTNVAKDFSLEGLYSSSSNNNNKINTYLSSQIQNQDTKLEQYRVLMRELVIYEQKDQDEVKIVQLIAHINE
ncbi:hypothetical protein BB561_002769 [Smittium simulii]|uniref:Uncharacterized protein n=1 Tax=Smittium simulii TaxID=133385 RepID=A0A2T9YP57_9FUNG|nr:hypothetical protein BB561_002769 [Smittium simulii]